MQRGERPLRIPREEQPEQPPDGATVRKAEHRAHLLRRDAFGAVGDGRELLSAALVLQPDVVVVDIAMPLLNGLDAARQLARTMPAIRTIILTVNEDPELAATAIRFGASGYLLKNCAGSELVQAIAEVMHRDFGDPIYTYSLRQGIDDGGVN